MMMNPHIASKKESSSSSAENFLKKGHRALNSTESLADYNGLYIYVRHPKEIMKME